MKRQRILLTGDDGYNSLGTRLLVHYLRNDFDLTITGTKTQQSGVGGYKHITQSGSWEETTIDGICALCVDGSPVDAVEAARVYFKIPFDYVISGINWGANIGGCLLSSGTFAAAFYSIVLGMTKHAVAISWDMPATDHFKTHSQHDTLSPFLMHPGKTAQKILKKVFAHTLWGADILNINIPQQPTSHMEFAKPLPIVFGLWPSMVLNKKTHMFSYGYGNRSSILGSKDTELQTLERNHIAISPCQSTMLHVYIYETMKKMKR